MSRGDIVTKYLLVGLGFVALLGICVGLMIGAVLVVLGEIRRYAADLHAQHQRSVRTLEIGLNNTLENVARVLGSSVETTIKTVVGSTLNSVLGEPGVEVKQGIVRPEDDLMHPHWQVKFDDGEYAEGSGPGVGDSVYVERGNIDPIGGGRATSDVLLPGESIIPGVPLPDMSGEGY